MIRAGQLQELGGSNYWMVAKNLQTNLHDVRLTFRWPLAKGTNAPGRQVFRTLVGGSAPDQ